MLNGSHNGWSANVAGARGPFTFEIIAGGHSNLTYRVVAADGSDIRAAPAATRAPFGERARHELASTGSSPVCSTRPCRSHPRSACAPTRSVNDAPFYVMGFVDGHVIRGSARARKLALTPSARRRASESLVDTMAAIHAVDLDACGLADLGKHEGYIARQLKRWYGQWNDQKTRDVPAIDDAHDALSQRIPEQGPRPRWCTGTTGSTTASSVTTVRSVLCSTGRSALSATRSPMSVSCRCTGPAPATKPRPGAAWRPPPRVSWTAAIWSPGMQLVSGRDLSQLPFYVSFAYWKLACILQGVYYRYLGGALGSRDPAELETVRHADRCCRGARRPDVWRHCRERPIHAARAAAIADDARDGRHAHWLDRRQWSRSGRHGDGAGGVVRPTAGHLRRRHVHRLPRPAAHDGAPRGRQRAVGVGRHRAARRHAIPTATMC